MLLHMVHTLQQTSAASTDLTMIGVCRHAVLWQQVLGYHRGQLSASAAAHHDWLLGTNHLAG